MTSPAHNHEPAPDRGNAANRLGWGMMIASVVVWAVLPALPFLEMTNGQRVAIAAAVLVVAEVLFWLGALLAGPDAVRRMKSWWNQTANTFEIQPEVDPGQPDVAVHAQVRTKPS